MLQTRIIPALLLRDNALVKTTRFNSPKYIGDPVNTVRIFNELEVDELVFLDITATNEMRQPNLDMLSEIANECFMPLGYGGGLKDMHTVKSVFDIGFEKVIVNSAAHANPGIITEIAQHYGNQAVVASIDVKKNFWGKYEVWTNAGKFNTKKDPSTWAKELEKLGAGEILLTSIDHEGTWSGFDLKLTKNLTNELSIPLIAHGGGGSISHISKVVKEANASAVALGSMVVYQQKGMGVLVSFPDKKELESALL